MKVLKGEKINKYLNLKYILIASLVLVNILIVCLGIYALHTFFITIPLIIVFNTVVCNIIYTYNKQQRLFIYTLSQQLNDASRESMYDFPIPVLCTTKEGKIAWYNDAFMANVLGPEELIGEDFSLISNEKPSDFCNRAGIVISYNERYYHVKAAYYKKNSTYLFYFEDNTSLIDIASEYKLSHPNVLLIMIDNYADVFEGKKESVKSAMSGTIDDILEKFVAKTTGFLKRLSKDRFLVVIEKRHLDEIIDEKISILDEIREIGKEENNPLTLSIGVGANAETLEESDMFAGQALDMALGRGGDQAAVKTSNGFDFYGGISKGVEKRTRVKSRVIATALRELIEHSDKVLLMGHRFGDLDSMGSSIGLASAVRKLDKKSYIVAKQNKTLAGGLFERIKDSDFKDMIIHPDDAMGIVSKKTLLIILDTHNPDFVESEELYQKCNNIVVIDHHRKMVKYIDDAVIFYHEPFASSASELVAELVQYLGEFELGRIEAEAMLAGIMLDTKNFVIKAGVRTFEAAAYLKSLGADTVSVRKLFSNTMEVYQSKSRIVSGAETYRNCAIALGDFQSDDMRVIAPQAADELLGISNVEASFVIYTTDGTVNISARSLGDINAQVVMEHLGGGGHHTQAACQIEDISIEKARQMLLEAIDKVLG